MQLPVRIVSSKRRRGQYTLDFLIFSGHPCKYVDCFHDKCLLDTLGKLLELVEVEHWLAKWYTDVNQSRGGSSKGIHTHFNVVDYDERYALLNGWLNQNDFPSRYTDVVIT